MDLASAAQWAEVLGLLTIFGAAIYSWLTINEIKRDRMAASSLKLSELWQNKDFSHGSISIWMQPDDLKTFAELEDFHGEDYPKVFTVLLTRFQGSDRRGLRRSYGRSLGVDTARGPCP